jgi:hypothetical protein
LWKVVDVPDEGGGMMGDSDGFVEKNIYPKGGSI